MTMTDTAALLTPGEVALMFGVDPKTVTRWAIGGRAGSSHLSRTTELDWS